MKIFISGISGTGMGPLALMAEDAGFEVFGTDLKEGAILPELLKAGIEVKIGEQDGEFLRGKIADGGVDWFVYTSALPKDHPELKLAREAGVKVSKRDDFTAFLVEKLGLKMVAVAGTHGKTTTAAMMVWLTTNFKLPVSYVVGTTLGFAPSGAYHKGDKYFIYEADEYDRNFLKFWPWTAVITTISYDHPDIYPTEHDYRVAFRKFMRQSQQVVREDEDTKMRGMIFEGKIAGEERRNSAGLAITGLSSICGDIMAEGQNVMAGLPATQENLSKLMRKLKIPEFQKIYKVLGKFPGAGRRFEKIAKGVYSDYAHHPEEIQATLEMANEQAEIEGKRGVIVVYQPHQNTRQHKVFSGYRSAFEESDKVFWLPTFLTRENPELKILEPKDFIESLENPDLAEAAEMNEKLAKKLKDYRERDFLILLMAAGPADEWFRRVWSK